jgi:hypothetical protein
MKVTDLFEAYVKLPNTKAGAIQAFKRMVDPRLADKIDIDNCKVTPNRTEEAKWHIVNPTTNKRVDVCLGGYEDADGKVRSADEFKVL